MLTLFNSGYLYTRGITLNNFQNRIGLSYSIIINTILSDTGNVT